MHILKIIEENKESKEVIFEKLLAEYKQACKALNFYGVPNERAKTLANGIDVLVARFREEEETVESIAEIGGDGSKSRTVGGGCDGNH
jgi:hypothetical protein